MAKKNKTKYALLGMLSMGPMSGYDIKKMTDMSISHFWSENFGHIYPVLKKMEAEGLVTKSVEETSGRPNRNIYSITEAGRRELFEWLLLPVEPKLFRNELLLKIFFADQIPVERIIEMVKEEKEKFKDNLKEFRMIEEGLKNDPGYKDDDRIPFWLITLSFGIHSSSAAVSWCDETIEILDSLLNKKPKYS
ncbi:MAG: PadR family transcriptional regulator [Deltaproteobacteria bacterium]|uniref:PadR family transcriptional regulator n=1 Tax=Candidatus Zymogenus saltonus TaxID=2844893 RepID=A0A9D8PQS5_9DELT|nr:PadR family transcriptional regulator [Candidatus Zymogenus saltonus]